MDRILLFIPCYNCEKQITRVLDQLKGDAEEYISQVILVNNRSTDNTENAIIDYLKENSFKMPVKLLRNHENYGLGGSHKVAFLYAEKYGFDYVITLHGDDQGHIADLLPHIKSGLYKQYDCLLGSRFMKGSKLEGYSKFRTFGNQVYNMMFSVATLSPVKDLGAGLNMYSTDMLKDHFYIRFADDLTFNNYCVLALKYYKQSHRFFPLVWSEDDQVSNVKLFNQAMRTIKLVAESVFSRQAFFKRDHRANPVKKYGADTVYDTSKK